MLIFEFIIIQAAVFLIIFFVFKRLVVQNTSSAVNRLKSTDEENMRRLEEMKKKLEAAEAEYQKKSAELAHSLEEQREKARLQVEEERTLLLTKAREEAERIIVAAQERSAKLAHASEKELQTRALVLSKEVVQNVLSKNMSAELNGNFIDELLQDFEGMELGPVPEQTQDAEIVLPHALNAERKKKLEQTLQKKLGRKIGLRETIKEGMLGGIILSFGSLVMDGSLESKLDEVLQEITKKV